jgi:AAA ATPase domain
MTLFGRGADQQALQLFAERADRLGGALVLTGTPGCGRTSLLDDLAERRAAAGVRVIRCTGVPGGVPSDHADMDSLIAPLYENLPALPDHLRESLSVAVGLAAGPPPSALSVGTAVTVLLRHTARLRPLLIAVDDVQHWDPASRALLGYVGRRLGNSRVGLVLTMPAAHRYDPELAGIGVHQLEPLDTGAAESMLRSTAGDLAAGVRRRVLADAAGNPLALAELPRALSDRQRAGSEALPPVLPVTTRLTTAYAPVIGDLPPAARYLLLVAALESSLDLLSLGRVGGADGSLAELTAAERAGLIRIDEAGRLRFSSPLVPLTVTAAAGAVELRRAHRALAGTLAELDPARALMHLARTAVHQDETIAGRLAEAAAQSLADGDPDQAADLWLLAAGRTPAPELRQARRHTAAAVRATALADPDGARQLIATDSEREPSTLVPAIVDVHFALREGAGLATAHDRLLATMEESAPHPVDPFHAEAVRTATLAAWRLGQNPIGAGVRPGPAGLLAHAFTAATGNDTGCLREVERVLRQIHGQHDPLIAAQASLGLAYLDRLGESRDVLRRLIDAACSGRAIGSALPVMASWCLADWPTGRWHHIDELTSEYHRLTARHDVTDFLSPLPRLAEGLLAAARGDRAAAVAAAARLSDSGKRRDDVSGLLAHHVSGFLALADGDFDLAYDHLAHLGDGAAVAHRSWAALDVIEAAWRSGHPDQARACVDALSRQPATRLSERLGWLVQAGHAVTAEPHDAGALLAAAVGAPAAQQWPLELARMHLAYGEHLGTRRDTDAARFHLSEAARIFRRLGVPAWHGRTQLSLWSASPGLQGRLPGHEVRRAAARTRPAPSKASRLASTTAETPYQSAQTTHRPPSKTFVSSARDDTPTLRKAR